MAGDVVSMDNITTLEGNMLCFKVFKIPTEPTSGSGFSFIRLPVTEG